MPPHGCFLHVLSPTGPKPQDQGAGLDDSGESLPTWHVLWFCGATSAAGDITQWFSDWSPSFCDLFWVQSTPPAPWLQLRTTGAHLLKSDMGWAKPRKLNWADSSTLPPERGKSCSPGEVWCERGHKVTTSKGWQGDWSVPGSCRSPSGEKALPFVPEPWFRY